MQILVNRSKVFMATEPIELEDPTSPTGKTVAEKKLRHFAPKGDAPTIQEAPDWIKNTMTYKVGIKDGSIKDFTPPATAEPAAPEPVAAKVKEDESGKGDDTGKGKSKDKGAEVGLQK